MLSSYDKTLMSRNFWKPEKFDQDLWRQFRIRRQALTEIARQEGQEIDAFIAQFLQEAIDKEHAETAAMQDERIRQNFRNHILEIGFSVILKLDKAF